MLRPPHFGYLSILIGVFMKKSVLFASMLALAGLSSVAAAADDSWFVRGDIGSTKVSVSGLGHDSSTGGSVGLGYYFNPYFGVEGSYMNLGSHNGVKADAWGVGIVGKTHFDQGNTVFFVDGRFGVDRAKVSVSGPGFDVSDSNTKIYAGAGIGYDFNPNFGLSLNYLYNNGSFFGTSAHAETVSVGGEVRF
jgi:opacity protein-like surface antigen